MKGKTPLAIINLVDAAIAQAENTRKPVRIYVGLKRTENKFTARHLEEPATLVERKNNFSYRATDEFTRNGGMNFFYKAFGRAEAGKDSQKDELEERAKYVRSLLKDYDYLKTPEGFFEFRPKNGRYMKIGDVLYYVLDVDVGYEPPRGAQRNLPFTSFG